MRSNGHVIVLVQELERGDRLTHLLDRGALTLDRGLVIVKQVLDALAHAHAKGVVHCNIKPENIALSESPDGRCAARARLHPWYDDSPGPVF